VSGWALEFIIYYIPLYLSLFTDPRAFILLRRAGI